MEYRAKPTDTVLQFVEGVNRNIQSKPHQPMKIDAILAAGEAVKGVVRALDVAHFTYTVRLAPRKRDVILETRISPHHPIFLAVPERKKGPYWEFSEFSLHRTVLAKVQMSKAHGATLIAPDVETGQCTLEAFIKHGAESILKANRPALDAARTISSIMDAVGMTAEQQRNLHDALRTATVFGGLDGLTRDSGGARAGWAKSPVNPAALAEVISAWGDCKAKRERFTKVAEKTRKGEEWVRYDGFDGRYSICITTTESGCRHIQIFTHRDTPNERANLYAPEMYVIVEDLTPVGVKLDMTSGCRRYICDGSGTGGNTWLAVKDEVDMGFQAAEEIQRRFIAPFMGPEI